MQVGVDDPPDVGRRVAQPTERILEPGRPRVARRSRCRRCRGTSRSSLLPSPVSISTRPSGCSTSRQRIASGMRFRSSGAIRRAQSGARHHAEHRAAVEALQAGLEGVAAEAADGEGVGQGHARKIGWARRRGAPRSPASAPPSAQLQVLQRPRALLRGHRQQPPQHLRGDQRVAGGAVPGAVVEVEVRRDVVEGVRRSGRGPGAARAARCRAAGRRAPGRGCAAAPRPRSPSRSGRCAPRRPGRPARRAPRRRPCRTSGRRPPSRR